MAVSTGGEPAQVPSWGERLAAVMAQYPSTADRYWVESVGDVELIGSLLREVVRVGGTPARGGQRVPDRAEGLAQLRRLWGEDFSTLPFPQALAALTAGRSLSHVVGLIQVRTGAIISRTQLHRFLRPGRDGRGVVPSQGDMEVLARAFGKSPTYFHEYRMAVVMAAVAAYLDASPEATASLVRRMGVDRR